MILYNKLRAAARKLSGRVLIREPQITLPTEFHGSNYGGWTVTPADLSGESIVYSFGIGEDISFDLSLIERYGCTIHAFDPTPRSLAWVGGQVTPPQLHIHDYGLEAYNGPMTFYPPGNETYISHTTLTRTTSTAPTLEVQMHRLSTVAEMLGHTRIDLLKMDIEGSEYAVIDDIAAWSHLKIEQLLIEFHPQFIENGIIRTNQAIRNLNRQGYKLFHNRRTEYAFASKEVIS